jgi:hypothetical protein
MVRPPSDIRSNGFLAFDGNGLPTVQAAASSAAPTSITRQVFSGTGSQTVFTLSTDPGAAGNSAQVFIGGVYQQRNTYTINGTTLTFSQAPVAGVNNVEFVNFLIGSGANGVGIVTLTGDVTGSGTGTVPATIEANAVTFAKMQTVATDRLLGRDTAGTGNVEQISLGNGLEFTGSGAMGLRDIVSVKDYGAVGDGVTDDTTAIQAAIDFAAPIGATVHGRGTFKTTSKVVIKGPFDGSEMQLNVVGSPAIALEVSTGSAATPTDVLSLSNSTQIILPNVSNVDKPTTGWAGQGTGVRYVNVQNSQITERMVTNFAIGVQHVGNDRLCGYNTVVGGFLRNNKVNREFVTLTATGACNRWDIIGGRYFHFSAEYVANGSVPITGCFHVNIVPAPAGHFLINDINFFGASLEGNAQEYQARVGGTFVNFVGCRWETTGGARIHRAYDAVAGSGSFNLVNGRGAGLTELVVTGDAGASFNSNIIGSTRQLRAASFDTILKNNNSGADNVFTVLSAPTNQYTANLATDYCLGISSQEIVGKREADAENRLVCSAQSGTVLVGDGATAPVAGLVAQGATGVRANGNWYFPDNGTAPGVLAGYAPFWFDETSGEFKFRRPDGTIRTITSS